MKELTAAASERPGSGHARTPQPEEMTVATNLTLRVNLDGAPSYKIGDEISLAQAIAQEADTIAGDAELLYEPTPARRQQLRQGIIAEMTTALANPGDIYTAPDGITYSLTSE
jgi:hypothetical protein